MFIRIEKGSSTPISRQIAEQVRAQCVSGALQAGECLPSVRQLARQLAVNVNTVLRVYERLAADGWIEMRHGEGTFVLPASSLPKSDGEVRIERDQLARELSAVVRRGVLLGVSGPELRQMFATALAETRETISKNQTEKNS